MQIDSPSEIKQIIANSSVIAEYCSKILQEYQNLEKQQKLLKQEIFVLTERKLEVEEYYQKSQLLSNKLSVECNKQTEIASKLLEILSGVIAQLPPQAQQTIREQIDAIYQHTNVVYDETISRRVSAFSEERRSPISDMIVNSTKSLTLDISSPDKEDEEDEEEEEMNTTQKKPRMGLSSPAPEKSESFYSTHSKQEEDEERNVSPSKKNFSKRSSARGAVISSPVPSSMNGIPKTSNLIATLPHGDVVCTVVFNNLGSHIFTGGKGSTKLWDIKNTSNKPIAELRSFTDCYIRTTKFVENEKMLIVGGETNSIVTWDLDGPTPRIKNRLNTNAACYGLSVDSSIQNIFYSCYSDGTVGIWDLNSGKQVKSLSGHTAAASCIEVSPDGSKLITGSLDSTMRIWDIGSAKELGIYNFPSQIFSLSVCPGDSWVAVGLENSHVEVLNLMNTECKYQLHMHENCVLTVKFANSGKWLITGGKDKTLNSWRSPFGSSIFQSREPNSILSCDISIDDCLIVTGSGDKLATVYEIVY